MSNIQDFGNKIGGARKDLWKTRGLIIDDLTDMNDAEMNKYITKDNVWSKPDYQAMYDSGLSKRIVFFIKTIRDGLPAKPQKNNREYQEGFISFVSDIRDKTMSIKDESEIYNYCQNVFLNQYVSRGSYYGYTALPNTYGCLSNKLFKAAQVSSAIYLDREISKKQFLYTDEEKILSKYSFYKYDTNNVKFNLDYSGRNRMEIKFGYGTAYVYPKDDDALEESWNEETYFVLDNQHNIILKNIDTIEEAKQKIIEIEKGKNVVEPTKKRKTKFVPEQLLSCKREGENYRNKHQITGEDMLDVFNFYGGEFGNWLNDKDRQANLNYSYDAFADLAKALNISNNDISFNGRLSIAYGARGHSKALAHYEPLRKVINLTKMKGAGSLAHEWGHALDHFLGETLGENKLFLTETDNELIKPILDTMKYRKATPEEAKETLSPKYKLDMKNYSWHIKHIVKYEYSTEKQQKKYDELIEKCCNETYENCHQNDETNINSLENLAEFYKQKEGAELTQDDIKTITLLMKLLSEDRQKMEVGDVKIETDYYKNSLAFDNSYSKDDKGYWASNIEMFARAFACYVKDKLSPNVSDYLCYHADTATTIVNGKVISAFPVGEERKNINKCFDELITKCKEKNLFQEYNSKDFTFENKITKHSFDNEEINALQDNNYEQSSFFDMMNNNQKEIADDFEDIDI